MKPILTVTALALTTIAALAEGPDYEAIRAVAKAEGGESALNRIVGVRGAQGALLPETWMVTVADPKARGGFTEYEVRSGKIVGQRKPTSRSLGKAIDFSKLQVDSESVVSVLKKELRREGINGARVDYSLRSSSAGGAPVWNLDVFDQSGARLGALDVSAADGTVLDKNWERQPAATIERDTPRQPVQRGPVVHDVPETDATGTQYDRASEDRVARTYQPSREPQRRAYSNDADYQAALDDYARAERDYEAASDRLRREENMREFGTPDGPKNVGERLNWHMERRGRQVRGFFQKIGDAFRR